MIKNDQKIIVYSININGYDELNTPTIVDPNIDYILFTDDITAKSDVWKIQLIDSFDKTLDLRKRARYLKINSHLTLPEHDISIYVDHCFEPKFPNALDLLNEINFSSSNIMCYKHLFRQCLYEEANTVIQFKLDNVGVVSNQMKRYVSMGFPKNFGLFESGFMIRKNNYKVKHFNETWWKEIKNNSGRDQLSQMFASWYSNVNINPILIGSSMESNQFISERREHKKAFKVVS